MDRIPKRVEKIFTHASVMYQSGKARNTVHCIKNRIYILNQDHTMLLKFVLRKKEGRFETPLAFSSEDYDSEILEARGDKICFTLQDDKYKRVKLCKMPELTPAKVSKYFKTQFENCKPKNKVVIGVDFLKYLQEDLSHIEFSVDKKGTFQALQRHIYAGKQIIITKEGKNKTLGLDQTDKIKPFKPIGIRTNDFWSLFGFATSIDFYFTNGDVIWFESTDPRLKFVGIFAKCKYDELGTI